MWAQAVRESLVIVFLFLPINLTKCFNETCNRGTHVLANRDS